MGGDGTWQAWVSWVQETGGPRVPKVVQARAGGLRPLGLREVCQRVLRRICGRPGKVAIRAAAVTARERVAG